MKKYFIYELKKNSYVLGALILIMVILNVAPIVIGRPDELKGSLYFDALFLYVGIAAVIVPIWLTNYKMKKRSVDLYYALPLSHTKILVARFLLGLIAVFVPYTLSFWLGALAMIAKINNTISAVWYVPFYFATLIPIYIIYSISAFVYTRANKSIDGFMFLLFWCFALALTSYAVEELVNIDCYLYLLPFDPLVGVTTFFHNKICNYTYGLLSSVRVFMLIGFGISTLMSIGATLGLLLTEKNAKAENVGQISESWFGYKTMIPLYIVCLISICALIHYLYIILIILITIAAFFASVLYKRTIKIGKRQAIILGVSFLVGITLSIINTYA